MQKYNVLLNQQNFFNKNIAYQYFILQKEQGAIDEKITPCLKKPATTYSPTT